MTGPIDGNPSTGSQTQDQNPSQLTLESHSTHTKVDPYLIHPSDSPTTVLLSPLLSCDNYASWARGIRKALNAKGKLCFIDGSLPVPDEPLLHDCWKRCDDLVGSWLLNSVQPDLRSSCMYANSSRDIWMDLKIEVEDR